MQLRVSAIYYCTWKIHSAGIEVLQVRLTDGGKSSLHDWPARATTRISQLDRQNLSSLTRCLLFNSRGMTSHCRNFVPILRHLWLDGQSFCSGGGLLSDVGTISMQEDHDWNECWSKDSGVVSIKRHGILKAPRSRAVLFPESWLLGKIILCFYDASSFTEKVFHGKNFIDPHFLCLWSAGRILVSFLSYFQRPILS